MNQPLPSASKSEEPKDGSFSKGDHDLVRRVQAGDKAAFSGVFRFVVEFWRGDPRGTIFGGALSTSQFVAILMVTAALGMLARLRMRDTPPTAEGSA